MKSFKSIAATLLACATIHAASAAVVLISVTPDSTGPASPDVTFDGLDPVGPSSVELINGLSLSYDDKVVVQDAGNPLGAYPFPASGSYLSVTTGGLATFEFSKSWGTFGFQWGSIDDYNTITFYNEGMLVGSYTGLGILAPADGDQGSGGSAYVVFGGLFDKVELRSSDNSFEIDNISVPDAGSSLALLGLAFVALAGFARRRAA